MEPEHIIEPNILNSQFYWTDPVEIQGAFGSLNTYVIGTPISEEKSKVFKKVFHKVNIPSQLFFQRKLQLSKIQHQNFVKVDHYQIKIQKKKGQSIVTKFVGVSKYIESIPASTFIKQKRQLYVSNLMTIIQQMVNLMVIAQDRQIYHYHLNSDSILLIQNENSSNSQYFLKVCDWGYQNQLCSRKDFKKLSDFLKQISQNSMFEYLHPELLFEQNNLNLYKQYKSKYDIWSFGIMLYQLTFLRRPFEYKGSFSPEVLLEHYKGKQKLQIGSHSILTALLQKMLSFKGFDRWSQIKGFFIQKAERVELDFLGIKQLYANHMNLISYIIQVYRLAAWSINNSANCFWYENKYVMKQFLIHLLKLIFLLHSKKFIQRFGHRMIELSSHQRKQHQNIKQLIQKQLLQKPKTEPNYIDSSHFFDNFEKLAECLLPIQIRIEDYSSKKSQNERSSLGVRIRQSWNSIKTIKIFSSKVLLVRNEIQNRNRNIFPCFFNIFNQKD